MMKEFLPDLIDIPCQNGAGSTGDGIRMGKEVGAQLLNMDAAMVNGVGSEKGGRRISGLAAILGKGSLLINQDSQRFFDEKKGYSQAVLPIMRQPNSTALLVFDEEILKNEKRVTKRIEVYFKKGFILYGKTACQLASVAKLDTHRFQEAVDQYFPQGGLYGIWVKPALSTT